MSKYVYVHHVQAGSLRLQPEETVLAACLRLGIDTPFSCRGGSCHTCLMRCTGGVVPERAQRGLSADQQAKGYFLPCVCAPIEDLHIAPIAQEEIVTVCLIDSIRDELDQRVWVLEPARTLPPLVLGQTVALSPHQVISPTPSMTRQGVILALPETHYFLEVQMPLDQGIDWACVGAQVQVGPVSAASTSTLAKRPTDSALWAELGHGVQVRQILDAFYAKVFADEQLAPYFQHTTAHHVAGKQYAFLYESMTGEDVYFGDNPYNAHHTMVISDALFDHRQHLMLQTLEEHGLSDAQIRRWTAFEEPYRYQIVKTQIVPRMGTEDIEPRPDGFAHETLSEGSVCDHCGSIIEAGTTVLYHQRLGTVSCPSCSSQTTQRSPHRPQ